jgi:hypothetical protein
MKLAFNETKLHRPGSSAEEITIGPVSIRLPSRFHYNRLRVESGTRPAAETWDRLWNADDLATFYQSREWAEIWSGYSEYRLRPDPVMLRFSDGAEMLLPFCRQAILGGIFNRHIASVPKVTMGGWLSKKRLTVDHVHAAYAYLYGLLKNVCWRLNPFDPVTDTIMLPVDRSSEMQTIDLHEDFERVYGKFCRTHRQAVNKATRAGLQIRQAECIDEWKIFYDIYLQSVERWGAKACLVHSWKLVEGLYRSNSGHMTLWLCCLGEKIIAGSLCLYGKKHIAPWLCVFDRNYVPHRPMHFLYCEIMKDACARKYIWFDMGISRCEGLRSFKEGFGARPYRSPVIEWHSPVVKKIRTLFRACS